MYMLSEMFDSAVRWHPDRAFLDDSRRRFTYRQAAVEVARLANVLADHGVVRGTPVCLYLPNCVELAFGYLATARLGAIYVPIPSMGRRREVGSILSRTDAPVLITDRTGAQIAETVRDQASLRSILVLGGSAEPAEDLDVLMASAPDHRERASGEIDDLAAVFFTSGTTGEPKGAMQTHFSVYSTVRDMAVFNGFRYGREVLLGVLPMFNNFGATCLMLAAVHTAGTLIVHERWDTERVLADIARYGATYFAGTPTMLVYLWKGYRPNDHDLSSLRLVIAGGAPIAPEVIDACQGTLGINKVAQIYGATEVCGYVTGDPLPGVHKRGSAGPAFGSTTITVVDEDGQELPENEVGELVISGDTVGPGYWRDPETTSQAYRDGGWRSGDLGRLDEDGYVYVVDRKKDLIISGGYNIYPLEVESVLYRDSRVRMCAVVGVADKVKGELAVAYIVADSPSAGLAAELTARCREELMAYKVPRRIEFVEAMPLGPTGKILKRDLREGKRSGAPDTPE